MKKMTVDVLKEEEIVMIPTRMVETRYALNMSKEEVQMIYDILMHVGGDPRLSRRKHATAILAALYKVDGMNRNYDGVGDLKFVGSSIVFNSNS